MLHLITGTPGSGKTLFAVSKIMEYVKQNQRLLEEGKEPRTIYADIDGLEIEGVEQPPEDWRDTPDGSVIFYDEIQQREFYKKGKNDNDVVNALQIHRHTGHDIYGITQFPVLLHQNFKAVVGLHYHLHRGWGLQSATVYTWAYCVDAPNAPSNKRLAEHTFKFSYPKSLFNVYKSATQHTHTRRIPKKFLFLLVIIAVLGYFTYSQLFGKKNFVTGAITGKVDMPVSATAVTGVVSATSTTAVTQSAVSVTQPQMPVNQGFYNPLHDNYIQDINKVPVAVVRFNRNCTAYNTNSQILLIPDTDCKQYLLKKGLLPVVTISPLAISPPAVVSPASPPAVVSVTQVSPVSAPAVSSDLSLTPALSTGKEYVFK